MPKYRNITTVRKMIDNRVVEPNGEIISQIFYDENEVGLLKVVDFPVYNPILYSAKIQSEETISIPTRDNFNNLICKYAIHLYVSSGEVTVWFNNIRNKPSLQLYNGAKWNVRCFERTVDKIIVSSEGAFVLYLIVEKL